MRTLTLLLGLLALGACSPVYGRQACTKNADCGELTCELCSATGDAGSGTTVSGVCQKPCTADGDCASLGLKKPKCATDTCGAKFCIDSPF